MADASLAGAKAGEAAPPLRQIGHSTLRVEDPPLLVGEGRFIDDIDLQGALEAAFVRSPHAHAKIAGIDATAARAAPGVVAVLSLADFAADPLLQKRMPIQFRTSKLPPHCTPFALAKDEVAYVGEPVALVVAASRYLAEDAAALVEVDYEVLPAVSDCRRALEPEAPRARLGRNDNILSEFRQSYVDIAAAFATAPHRESFTLKQHRGGAHSIEGRGVVASFDPGEDRLTVWSSTQLAHELRNFLVELLDLDENRLRVVTPDLAAYERFLKAKLTRLEGVRSIESSFALGQIKHTNVLPIS